MLDGYLFDSCNSSKKLAQLSAKELRKVCKENFQSVRVKIKEDKETEGLFNVYFKIVA